MAITRGITRSPLRNAIRSIIGGKLDSDITPSPVLLVGHMGLIHDSNGGNLVNGRYTPATIIDHEGLVPNCRNNEIRYIGARRVENLESDPIPDTNGTWIIGGGIWDNLLRFYQVTARYDTMYSNSSASQVQVGDEVTATFWVRGKTGGSTFRHNAIGSAAVASNNSTAIIPDGDSLVTFTWLITGAGLLVPRFQFNQADDFPSYFIDFLQIEVVSGQADTSPSKQVGREIGNSGLPGIQYFDTTKSGEAIFPAPRMLHEPERRNDLSNNVDLTSGIWLIRGAPVKSFDLNQRNPSGSMGASLLEGIANAATGDVRQATVGGSLDVLLAVSMYIKKVSQTGLLRISNPQSGALGDWTLNLGLMGDDWELISAIHPAITVANVFKTHATSGAAGLNFGGTTADTTDFYVWGTQQERGPDITSTIITEPTAILLPENPEGGIDPLPENPEVLAATTRVRDNINIPIAEGVNFNQEKGVCIMQFLPRYDSNVSDNKGVLSIDGSTASLFRHHWGNQTGTRDSSGSSLTHDYTPGWNSFDSVLLVVIWDATTDELSLNSLRIGGEVLEWTDGIYSGTYNIGSIFQLFGLSNYTSLLDRLIVVDALINDNVADTKDWIENYPWDSLP